MTYAELYPSLVVKNLIQSRNPLHTPEPLLWWYKPDLHCAFHQGAPDHDIENCYPLKYGFQKLFKSGMMSFEDRTPNVKVNPLPAHGNSSMNMVMVVLVISKFLMFVVSKGIWCRYIELCTWSMIVNLTMMVVLYAMLIHEDVWLSRGTFKSWWMKVLFKSTNP